MMTDRELLELAAKAYWGEELDDVCSVEWSEADQAIAYIHADNQDHNGIDRTFVWNPLEDDGDALRLAVVLGMKISMWGTSIFASVGSKGFAQQDVGSDRLAATRRAIVRVAAELALAQRT